jgi:hypothetical protein
MKPSKQFGGAVTNGFPARLAIIRAYSDVKRHIKLATLDARFGGVVLVWQLLGLTLPAGRNLADASEGEGTPIPRWRASPGRLRGGVQDDSGSTFSQAQDRSSPSCVVYYVHITNLLITI